DKLPIYWHPKERPPLRNIYRDLIKLRKQCPAFRSDQVSWLKNTDDKNVVTFLREDDNELFIVAINLCNRPVSTVVEELNDPGVALPPEFQAVKISGVSEPPAADFPLMHLNGFEWRIYRRAVTK